jgi:hypothetical protein
VVYSARPLSRQKLKVAALQDAAGGTELDCLP